LTKIVTVYQNVLDNEAALKFTVHIQIHRVDGRLESYFKIIDQQGRFTSFSPLPESVRVNGEFLYPLTSYQFKTQFEKFGYNFVRVRRGADGIVIGPIHRIDLASNTSIYPLTIPCWSDEDTELNKYSYASDIALENPLKNEFDKDTNQYERRKRRRESFPFSFVHVKFDKKNTNQVSYINFNAHLRLLLGDDNLDGDLTPISNSPIMKEKGLGEYLAKRKNLSDSDKRGISWLPNISGTISKDVDENELRILAGTETLRDEVPIISRGFLRKKVSVENLLPTEFDVLSYTPLPIDDKNGVLEQPVNHNQNLTISAISCALKPKQIKISNDGISAAQVSISFSKVADDWGQTYYTPRFTRSMYTEHGWINLSQELEKVVPVLNPGKKYPYGYTCDIVHRIYCENLPTGHGLDFWNEIVENYLSSIDIAGQGLSYLPKFNAEKPDSPTWSFEAEIKDQPIFQFIDEGAVAGRVPVYGTNPYMPSGISLGSVQHLIASSKGIKTPVNIQFEGINSYNPKPIKMLLNFYHEIDSKTQILKVNGTYKRGPTIFSVHDYNIGALNITWQSVAAGEANNIPMDGRGDLDLKIFRLATNTVSKCKDLSDYKIQKVNLNLRAPVIIKPIGQDDPPDGLYQNQSSFKNISNEALFGIAQYFQADKSVVHTVLPQTVNQGLILTIDEQSEVKPAPQYRRIRHRIERISSKQNKGVSYPTYVIDTHPFYIIKVNVQEGALLGRADGTGVVAYYDSLEAGGARWIFRDQTNEAVLCLPPQTVGEAMEKGAIDESGNSIDIQEIERPDGSIVIEPVDFKFSPIANLHINLEERSAIPQAPWNIRNLLISSAPDLPGTKLHKAVFDLAYGMETTLESSDLRLVESFAWRGQPPRINYLDLADFDGLIKKIGDLTVQKDIDYLTPYKDLRLEKFKNWGQSYKTWSKRLALFEVRDEQEKNGSLFRDEDVDFRLRAGVTAWPISPKKTAQALAKPGTIKNALSLTPRPEEVGRELKQLLLAGGVLWGAEESVILENLAKSPKSIGGSIGRLAFSALGGWGDQEAHFDKGLTIIKTNTDQGRLNGYTLIRMGRIAVFWNLARHVIEFERVPLRSEQFHQQNDGWGGQEKHEGHMVLRKTREYIEIIDEETELNLPVVKGTKFQKRINVDSNWSEIVNDKEAKPAGYKIPLWQRQAALDKPTVYQFPDIKIRAAAGAETEQALQADETQGQKTPTVLCGCANPNDIYFYTQTKTPLSEALETDAALKAKSSDDQYEDPRSWDPVYLVDFIDLPMDCPDPNKLRASDFRKEDDRELLDDHPECAPGYGNFTFKLKDSARINLLDGKAATNIAAKVKNLTVMRAVTPSVLPPETSDSPNEPPRVKAAKFLANRQNKPTQIRAVNELYKLSLKVKEDVGQAIEKAKSFEKFCENILFEQIGWSETGAAPKKDTVLYELTDFVSKPDNKPLADKTNLLIKHYKSLGRNINILKNAAGTHNLNDLIDLKDPPDFNYTSWLKDAKDKITTIKNAALEVVSDVRTIIGFVIDLRKDKRFEDSLGETVKSHFNTQLTALEKNVNDEIERVNKRLIPIQTQVKKIIDEALKVQTDLEKYNNVAADIIDKISADNICEELTQEFKNKFEREIQRGRRKILNFQQKASDDLDDLAKDIKGADPAKFIVKMDKAIDENFSRLEQNSNRVFADIQASILNIQRQINSKINANDILVILKLNPADSTDVKIKYQLHRELVDFVKIIRQDLPSKSEVYDKELSDWVRQKQAHLSAIIDREFLKIWPLRSALKSVILDYKHRTLHDVSVLLSTLPLHVRQLGSQILSLTEEEFDKTLLYVLDETEVIFTKIDKAFGFIYRLVQKSLGDIGAKLLELDDELQEGLDVDYEKLRIVVNTSLEKIEEGLMVFFNDGDEENKPAPQLLKDELNKVTKRLHEFIALQFKQMNLEDKADKINDFWTSQLYKSPNPDTKPHGKLRTAIYKERDKLAVKVTEVIAEGTNETQKYLALIDKNLRQNSTYLDEQLNVKKEGSWAQELSHDLFGPKGDGGAVEDLCKQVQRVLAKLLTPDQLQKVADELNGTIINIIKASKTILKDIENLDQVLLKTAQKIIEKIPDDFEFNLPDAELYLSRIFSYMPEISDLGFNRLVSAFFYDLEKAVRTLPVSTLLDRFGDQLKGMSISLPTIDISDYFNPPDSIRLPDFNVGDILPDFGFLKNKGLFNGKSIGNDVLKHIKITHDIDKKEKIAWAKAAVNVNLGTADLLPTKVVRLQIIDAKLDGHLRIQTDIQGNVEREVKSKLSGDWALGVSSTTILTMKETAVNYDERSGVTFDFDPKKIDYSGGLKFLKMISDKYQKTQEEGPPPIVERLFGDGLPYGFYNYFNIPIPDIASGPFVLSNLELNTLLAAQLNLEDLRNPDFTITAAAELSKEDDPFLMLIAFLGGTGYINIDTNYSIFSQDRETNVNLGLGAAAGGAFTLGPIKGDVSIKFMIEAHYRDTGRGGSSLSISARILLNGNVKAWVVSINIAVSLSVTYTKTQTIGHGYISVKVRICKFVKKKFKKNFKKRLSGSGEQTTKTIAPAGEPRTPAMIVAAEKEALETLTPNDNNLSRDEIKKEVNAILMCAL